MDLIAKETQQKLKLVIWYKDEQKISKAQRDTIMEKGCKRHLGH